MPGAEEVWERDIVGLVVVHTRLHVGPAAYQSLKKNPVLRIRIRDSPMPFWPLDPGSRVGKKSGPGPGMNNPDNISKSLETIFWVKMHKFFDADPWSGTQKFGSGIWRKTSRIRNIVKISELEAGFWIRIRIRWGRWIRIKVLNCCLK